MKQKILSKEQLGYALNLTPSLYRDKKEMLAWWKLRQPIRIKQQPSFFKQLITKICRTK